MTNSSFGPGGVVGMVDSHTQAVGGKDPTPPLQSPQEAKMREHILKILSENGQEMRPVVSVCADQYFSFDFVGLLGGSTGDDVARVKPTSPPVVAAHPRIVARTWLSHVRST